MGEVFRARDTRLGREVAVKVLPEAVATDPERLRRFEREARAASSLNHPNILTIHDVGSEQGRPYVVSELLEGQTLRQALAAGRLPLDRIQDWSRQILSGLAIAHDKSIIHRDLKPENLFVTTDGRVKILDFGLAKLLAREDLSPGGDASATQEMPTGTGLMLGTVGYSSPEQVRGREVDQRTDLFAFGAVLYEMLTGHRAFSGESPADRLSAILTHEPPPPSDDRQDTPPALDLVVSRCLAKDPTRRFQSARDLMATLDTAFSAAGAKAAARRRRLAALLIATAATLLIVVAGFLATRSNRTASPEPGAATAERPAAAQIESLAVLPLTNLSGDPGEQYFADGMTEALISALARQGRVTVLSRTAVMPYREESKSPQEIAAELAVDAVVEGSVTRGEDQVRVTASLLDPEGRVMWSDSYERHIEDVLLLQEQVAQSIARAVGGTLDSRASVQRLSAAGGSIDKRAYELTLRGRYQWEKRTAEGLQEAIDDFQAALAIDPEYAPAWSGVSDAYLTLYDYGLLSLEEATAKARPAATRALEYDSGLADAYTSLAHLALHDWNWQEAERLFRKALELDPSYALAYHWYALALTTLGRVDEAVATMEKGRGLDPLSLRMNADLGMAYLAARRPDAAIVQERETLKLEPEFPVAHWILGMAYEQKGMYDEAISTFERSLEIAPGSANRRSALGHALARAGRVEEARELARTLEAEGADPFFIALVHSGLRDRDTALSWLAKAIDQRSGSVRYLKIEPRLDPLRDDPRFTDLLRRAGLPLEQPSP